MLENKISSTTAVCSGHSRPHLHGAGSCRLYYTVVLSFTYWGQAEVHLLVQLQLLLLHNLRHVEVQLRVLGALDEARAVGELDDDALGIRELKTKFHTSHKTYKIVGTGCHRRAPACKEAPPLPISYMLPLLVGLLKGLGEDLYIGGPFGFGL